MTPKLALPVGAKISIGRAKLGLACKSDVSSCPAEFVHPKRIMPREAWLAVAREYNVQDFRFDESVWGAKIRCALREICDLQVGR